jgi:hypothetical protein
MTRQEFYDIMEMFGAYASIPPKAHAMMEILEMYPNLKSMTCEDALEWLENRDFEWYQKLQKKLGVEDSGKKLTEAEIANQFLRKANETCNRGGFKPADHIKMAVSQDNGWHTRNDLPELDDDLNSEMCVVITNNNGYRLKTASVVMGHWSEPNVEWWAYWPYNKK